MRAALLRTLAVTLTALAGCPIDPGPEPQQGDFCGVPADERPDCAQTLPSHFESTTVLAAGCYRASETPRLGDAATLTLSPGVTILFASGTGLSIADEQVLIATGTADQPICLSGQSTTRGAWDGLRFDGTSSPSQLTHVIVEYGGDTEHDADNAGIKASADSRGVRLTMTHTTVRQSAGWGLWLVGSAVIDGFASNTLTGNALGPISVDSAVVGSLDSASVYTGNDVDQVRVRAYRLAGSATWLDLGLPYYLEDTLRVETADLTLVPGVTLIMASGTHIEVNENSAALIAAGTAAAPILFTGEIAARGAWGGLIFDGSNNDRNVLAHVTVEWAGNTDADTDGAAVKLVADSRGVQLAMTHTTLRQSQGWGLYAVGSAVLPDFADNTLTENALGPALCHSRAVHQLTAASTFTGNDVDQLQVHSDYIDAPVFWEDLGVPYALDSVLSITAEWVLGLGVTLIMQSPSGRLDVNTASGSLKAAGSPERPILITAATPVPGSWQGLVFDTTEDQGNMLEYVTIEYAGAAPVQYPGAIMLRSDSRPIHLAIANSTVRHNAGYGLWLCGSAQVNSDLDASNTFTDNASGDVYRD